MKTKIKFSVILLFLSALIFAACGGEGGGGLGDKPVINDDRSISAGAYHSMIVRGGIMYVCGLNDYYQLGRLIDEDFQNKALFLDDVSENNGGGTPVDVHWTMVSAGGYHTMAIGDFYDHNVDRRVNSSLWGWGQHSMWQTPYSFELDYVLPSREFSDTKWIEVSAGEYHSLAISKDHVIWAHGYNYYSQVGDLAWIEDEGMNSNWIAVSAGKRHSMAIKIGGSLWGWGDNAYNQLGIIDADPLVHRYSIPVQVDSGHTWKSVSAGAFHTAAITTNGELYAWGGTAHTYEYLGDGTRYGKETPVRIGTDSDWKTVSVGYDHTVALKTDGRLFIWGPNQYGQLGIGSSDVNHYETSPVEVTPGHTWMLADAGDYFTIAMKDSGAVWAWGINSYGQLGNGTYDWAIEPVKMIFVGNGVVVGP
jgi:alpha-tubulin suppressor-like RCC1 family protein